MSMKQFRALLAAVLALTGLTLALAVPAQAETVSINQGNVKWGFKQSWRNYIGEAGITVSGGATRAPDGDFNWPVVDGGYDSETHALELDLAGTVHFTAHDGLLDSTLSNGRLVLNGQNAEIRFDIHSKNMAGEWVDFTDAPLAILDAASVTPDITDGVTTWAGIPTAITQQGADAFTYAAGTIIDPLTVTYEGPGGKPSFAESWTAPRTFKHEITSSKELLPRPSAASWVTEAFFDHEAGVVHALAVPEGLSSNHLIAIDIETGQPISQIGPITASRYTYDAETSTFFAAGTGLAAYTWDDEDQEYSEQTIATGLSAGTIAYDPTTETLAHLTPNGGGLVTLARLQADGSFTVTQRAATGVVSPNALQIDDRGNLLYAHSRTGARVHQILISADPLVSEPVEGIGTAAYTQVALGKAGEAWGFGTTPSFQNMTRLVRQADGRYVASGDPRPMAQAASSIKFSPSGEYIFGLSPFFGTIQSYEDGEHRGTIETTSPASASDNKQFADVADDGSLLVITPDPSLARPDSTKVPWKLDRYEVTAVSPEIDTHPSDRTVDLAPGEASTAAEFTVEAAGSPGVEIQWQSRSGGIGRFADIEGETGNDLRVEAGKAQNGTEYRAVLGNAAGSIATEAATLTVRYAPEITQQPVSVGVAEGGEATLKVMPVGNPHPQVTWERRQSGFWVPVNPDGIEIVTSGEGNGFLTIKAAEAAQSGAVFRAKVSNEIGTVYSNHVTLTVEKALTGKVTFGSGHVDWGIANRWRCYVTGNIARGGIELTGGITRIPGTGATGGLCQNGAAGSEALRFPVLGDSYDPESGRLELRLAGTVRFWGHAHHRPGDDTPQLDSTFSNLRVILDGSSGTVVADTAGATMDDPAPVQRKDVPLVTVDATGNGPAPTGQGLAWADSPTSLTAAGSAVFGDYPAGEPFDPISMNLVYGTPVVDPDPVDPEPVDPDPTPVRKVKSPASLRVSRRNRVATVACPPAAACRVNAPRRIRIKVAGKSRAALIRVPARIAAGKSRPVMLRLSKATVKGLRGRTAKVSFRLVATSAGVRTVHRVKVTLRGGPARR